MLRPFYPIFLTFFPSHTPMNSKQFLQVGGVILLALGIIGYVMPNLIPDVLWFDPAENVAHTVLGVVALIASAALPMTLQKPLVYIVAVVALFFGIAGFMVTSNPVPNFYGYTNLEMLDNVVHLVVGVWAIWAAMNTK